MSRDASLYLEDIIIAADDVREFVGDLKRDAFLKDKKTIAATTRCFEIIGEAVKQLPQEWRDTESEIPWRSIAGLRDMLAHGYFKVDDSVIWDSASVHLPNLVTACERIQQRVEKKKTKE
jgi:uncharacterized protein with HEPN domain